MRKHTAHRIVSVVLVMMSVSMLAGCMTPASYDSGASFDKTISVEGVGVVQAEPDTASLQITITELRDTTREAQSIVNEKVSDILTIADAHGVDKADIHTVSISFNQEYEWIDGKRVLQGQRVSQTMTIMIKGIDEEVSRVARLLDGLGAVSGIEISSLSFLVEDTAELYSQARKLAFNKAKQKAEEFAALGSVILGPPLSISEYSQDQAVRSNMVKGVMMESASFDYAPSQIPSGAFDVRVTVTVLFAIE